MPPLGHSHRDSASPPAGARGGLVNASYVAAAMGAEVRIITPYLLVHDDWLGGASNDKASLKVAPLVGIKAECRSGIRGCQQIKDDFLRFSLFFRRSRGRGGLERAA